MLYKCCDVEINCGGWPTTLQMAAAHVRTSGKLRRTCEIMRSTTRSASPTYAAASSR